MSNGENLHLSLFWTRMSRVHSFNLTSVLKHKVLVNESNYFTVLSSLKYAQKEFKLLWLMVLSQLGFRDVALLYNVSHVQAWPRWTLPALSVIHLRTKSLLISAWKLFYRHPHSKQPKFSSKKLRNWDWILDCRLYGKTIIYSHHRQAWLYCEEV